MDPTRESDGLASGPAAQPENAKSLPEHFADPAWTAFGLDIQVWIRDIFVSLAIAAVVIVFLYQPVNVEGTSMMPWLQDQERIFVNKFLYNFDEVGKGDVIVFRFPLDPQKSYIKRVVGVSGDVVEIIGGQLFVNGESVDEWYVPAEYRDPSSHAAVVVPDASLYVLGDHRNTSNDSRMWGTVPLPFVTGKAVFAYWPLERFGVLE
ncbi:MAG: signal peptidase I [Acidobacteria bacterium]|nr:signal peptidase I [Acidobacteriota bacterium]MDA1234061.1 signal peptidase I [Acidobacteriota bacterium]